VHDIADVEAEYPVVGSKVLHSECAPRRDFVFLLDLKLVHLFEGLEGDLEFLLLSHSVLEILPPLFEIESSDGLELNLNID